MRGERGCEVLVSESGRVSLRNRVGLPALQSAVLKSEVTNSQPEELCVDPHPASNRQGWRGGLGGLPLDWRVPYSGRSHELEIWILKSSRPGGRYNYYLPGTRPI